MTLKELKNGDIYWDKEGVKRGLAYRIDDKKIGLIRCPHCYKENYALNVASGQCTWCNFNANSNA